MRVPSYRRHASGQARVTIHGKEHLLGKYGSRESKEKYGRLIAEYSAANHSSLFKQATDSVTVAQMLLAYIKHAKAYYGPSSTEYANMKPVMFRRRSSIAEQP